MRTTFSPITLSASAVMNCRHVHSCREAGSRGISSPISKRASPSQQTMFFGKPVPKGTVKIVRNQDPLWNPKTHKSESSDKTVAEGEADASGAFVAALDLSADQKDLAESDSQRFRDIHFAAYYTDSGERRTEQRRFDVRITREPIHVYLITGNSGASSPILCIDLLCRQENPLQPRLRSYFRTEQ